MTNASTTFIIVFLVLISCKSTSSHSEGDLSFDTSTQTLHITVNTGELAEELSYFEGSNKNSEGQPQIIVESVLFGGWWRGNEGTQKDKILIGQGTGKPREREEIFQIIITATPRQLSLDFSDVTQKRNTFNEVLDDAALILRADDFDDYGTGKDGETFFAKSGKGSLKSPYAKYDIEGVEFAGDALQHLLSAYDSQLDGKVGLGRGDKEVFMVGIKELITRLTYRAKKINAAVEGIS